MDPAKSTEVNAFLVSALFSSMSSKVEVSTIESKTKKLKEENLFKMLFVLSIQKGTYEKVYSFLKEESEKS
jgi:hypothetical protein